MPRIVILGTGTEVGKTYFSCELAAALRRHCATHRVTAIKPIESGVPAKNPSPDQDQAPSPTYGTGTLLSDAEHLAAASTPSFAPPDHAYALPLPVSPHLAARLAGQSIDLKLVREWIANIETKRSTDIDILRCTCADIIPNPQVPNQHWLLVETAGGTFTPLAEGKTNMTLAIDLEPAIWVLVAPDKLGVLHDVTATLSAMRASRRSPDMLVLSEPATPDTSTGTNARELAALGIATPSVVLRRGGTLPTSFVSELYNLAHRRFSTQ